VNFRVVVLGLCGSVLGACTMGVADKPTAGENPVTDETENIVRGHTEKRLPQVVAFRSNLYSGGWELCSGTYISSRVVVTAAHCIRPNAIPGQSFVYFGNDYLGDQASLPTIPPPGASSKWARVETITVNPDYEANVNYPDLAILFLDRELPFDPIPLDRSHVGKWEKEGKIVGWGGSLALTPDISQVEGAGIKRSANVKILGSPTEADYHADDPNPGMLDPAIRPNLLKTDGRAPRANTCAGDSGGPLLTEHHGHNQLSGVGFWTGLSCEDYAVFTRIDPFLGFFDSEEDLAGKAPVVPRFECVEDAGNGKKRAYFGYENDNSLTVNIPYGYRNSFDKDVGHDRPTAFGPGDNPYAFSVEFNAADKLKWTLAPKAGPTTTVRADASSAACNPDDVTRICADGCNAQLAAECSQPGLAFSTCVSNCVGEQQILDAYYGCGGAFTDYMKCVGGVAPAASNWDCSFPGFPATAGPGTCDEALNNFYACFYY
jgi:hypothetical protein